MDIKIKSFLIILAGITEYLTLQMWFACKDFTDIFHHSSINLTLQIEDLVHAEKGTSLFLTRLFTNKITDEVLDLLRFYMQFWDIRFGSIWFSLLGYLGILFGFYYIFANTKKKWYHWVMLTMLLVLPWIEIMIEPHVSILIKSIYLWFPFSLFSLYGIYQFLSHGN